MITSFCEELLSTPTRAASEEMSYAPWLLLILPTIRALNVQAENVEEIVTQDSPGQIKLSQKVEECEPSVKILVLAVDHIKCLMFFFEGRRIQWF